MTTARRRAATSTSTAVNASGPASSAGPAIPGRTQHIPESRKRAGRAPSRPGTWSRRRSRWTPSSASAAESSCSRRRASSSGSPVRWASSGGMTSPRSPRVQVTTETSTPASTASARRLPAPIVSSSGWARTVRRRCWGRVVIPPLLPTGVALTGLAGPRRGLRPLHLVEDDLAHPHRLRGHLDALVVAGELQRLLQREAPRRDEVLEGVGGGRAHVRLLLLPGDVDVHVAPAGALADDLPLVDRRAGLDDEGAALLEVDHGVRRHRAGAVGDHRAAGAGVDRTVPRLVARGDRRRDAGAAGLGEEAGAEADEPPGRDDELHPYPAGPVVRHRLHPPLALG